MKKDDNKATNICKVKDSKNVRSNRNKKKQSQARETLPASPDSGSSHINLMSSMSNEDSENESESQIPDEEKCCVSRKHAYIMLTPLKSHFYIVKLGFTGIYIIVLISAQNIDCRYSLEPPRRGGSNEYPQSMF